MLRHITSYCFKLDHYVEMLRHTTSYCFTLDHYVEMLRHITSYCFTLDHYDEMLRHITSYCFTLDQYVECNMLLGKHKSGIQVITLTNTPYIRLVKTILNHLFVVMRGYT